MKLKYKSILLISRLYVILLVQFGNILLTVSTVLFGKTNKQFLWHNKITNLSIKNKWIIDYQLKLIQND